jgi:succinate dehydrogenase / fumarate reductase cytochrome b subunit
LRRQIFAVKVAATVRGRMSPRVNDFLGGNIMAHQSNRPLSPHLQIWRWGPAMLVSILHRVSGSALAFGGTLLLLWWLVAAAGGPESYASFIDCMMADDGNKWQLGGFNLIPLFVLVGLSWSFFQHLGSGLRHFVLDIGAGYELQTNRMWSIAVIVGALLATIALWASILTR